VAVTTNVAGATATTPSVTASTSQQGGVLGTTASAGKGKGAQGGVLGAIEAVGQGALPFTGFPLWAAVAAALALIGLGITLRRYGGVTA
jgi:hypothetical protein